MDHVIKVCVLMILSMLIMQYFVTYVCYSLSIEEAGGDKPSSLWT